LLSTSVFRIGFYQETNQAVLRPVRA
jgi:hypothetical protein